MLNALVQQGKLTPADAQSIMQAAATGVINTSSLFTTIAAML